jgi:hypothetical protein
VNLEKHVHQIPDTECVDHIEIVVEVFGRALLWMNVAALSTFRKRQRLADHNCAF